MESVRSVQPRPWPPPAPENRPARRVIVRLLETTQNPSNLRYRIRIEGVRGSNPLSSTHNRRS